MITHRSFSELIRRHDGETTHEPGFDKTRLSGSYFLPGTKGHRERGCAVHHAYRAVSSLEAGSPAQNAQDKMQNIRLETLSLRDLKKLRKTVAKIFHPDVLMSAGHDHGKRHAIMAATNSAIDAEIAKRQV
ncbi:MAG: hypothetical protein AAGF28_00930 [Pseudomonadota bacterium]